MSNPTHDKMLRYFEYEHLPEGLQQISKPFAELADQVARNSRLRSHDPAETTVALRKLLEAKDAAVRAALATRPTEMAGQTKIDAG